MANILLVEDEPILLELISKVLEFDGHHVKAFSSPLDALNSYRSCPLEIDLLLADVSLRPISGFDLFTYLGKVGYGGPVLFTSGYPEAWKSIASSLGGHAFLQKPFTAEQLRSAVSGASATSRSLHAA